TFATAKIPEPQRFKDADMGVFYNPAISNRMPDYMEYMGEVTASANLYFAKIVHEVAPKMFVNTFYGYYSRSMSSMYHTGFPKVLESPYIDAFRSPTTYRYRHLGGFNTS